MVEAYRYAAFISYSSKDAKFARRLHRALESYHIPASLGRFDLIGSGGKVNRIYPVFRDREELSAGGLGDQIEANLKASGALIVVCSPSGAASPWVQKEIEFFAAQGRSRIFAIISDTAPISDEFGADCTLSCFPSALNFDAIAAKRLDPLAADARKGKDGFRAAWLKIVAGLIEVPLGDLVNRDAVMTRRKRLIAGGAAVFAAVLAVGGSLWWQTVEWRRAFTHEAQRQLELAQPSEAAAFAIAGAAEPMSIPGESTQTDHTLSQSFPNVPVRLLGRITQFVFSNGAIATLGNGGELVTIYRLSDGGVSHQLDVAAVDGIEMSPDGRWLGLWRSNDGQPLLEVVDLMGRLPSREFRADGYMLLAGGNLVAFRRHGDLQSQITVFDLAREGRVRDLGLHRLAWTVTPASGAWLSLVQMAGTIQTYGEVIELEGGSRTAIGPLDWIGASHDGSRLVWVDRSRNAAFSLDPLVDVAPKAIGRISSYDQFRLSRDGSVLLGVNTEDQYRAAVADTSGQGEFTLWRRLGQVQRFDINADGRWVLGSVGPPFAEHKLFAWNTNDSRRSVELGAISNFVISIDGQIAVTHHQQGNGSSLGQLIELGEEIRQHQLGNLGRVDFVGIDSANQWAAVSGDTDPSQPGFELRLISLAGSVSSNRDREALCAANGDWMLPLPRSAREGALRASGRPWHPCDWRGLFYFNDGWEGLAQFIRYLRVRYFNGPDYACGEWNAAGRTDGIRGERRSQMCELRDEIVSQQEAIVGGRL